MSKIFIKTNVQQVILNVSRIFLARIKVWSKLLCKNFYVLWSYRFKCYLLINFNILQHNALYPTLPLKEFNFSIWTRQTFACSKSTIKHVWNMFTVNNKDTGTTPLSSFLILNSFYTLFLGLSSLFWTGISFLGRMILQVKPLKIRYFLPFNFSITNICVAIRLANDGTRMGGI